MNVTQALQQAFGPDAMQHIDTSQCNSWLNAEVKPLRLITDRVPGREGAVFVRCGGDAFAKLSSADENRTTFRFYLVHCDSDGKKWDHERRQFDTSKAKEWTPEETKAWHTPRPSSKIRLVASV